MSMDEVDQLAEQLLALEAQFVELKSKWLVVEKNSILHEVNRNFREIVRYAVHQNGNSTTQQRIEALMQQNEQLFEKIEQDQA